MKSLFKFAGGALLLMGAPLLRADSILSSSSTAPPPAPTPEPSSFVLLGSGLLGAAGVLRSKQVTQEPLRDRQRINEFRYPRSLQ